MAEVELWDTDKTASTQQLYSWDGILAVRLKEPKQLIKQRQKLNQIIIHLNRFYFLEYLNNVLMHCFYVKNIYKATPI